jgi:hypothetical protein
VFPQNTWFLVRAKARFVGSLSKEVRVVSDSRDYMKRISYLLYDKSLKRKRILLFG